MRDAQLSVTMSQQGELVCFHQNTTTISLIVDTYHRHNCQENNCSSNHFKFQINFQQGHQPGHYRKHHSQGKGHLEKYGLCDIVLQCNLPVTSLLHTCGAPQWHHLWSPLVASLLHTCGAPQCHHSYTLCLQHFILAFFYGNMLTYGLSQITH